ncbi:DEAD/DEAH box helicase [Paenibacillus sp. YYML68]|uniref:DEAD/DEAH box helicase n=1 Tax=Paenibacillus sp. YYML68 TaxID=2909250 RepID=UPI00249293F9|nr:helicase-related protein [Paenibacillus sp. YYML68]
MRAFIYRMESSASPQWQLSIDMRAVRDHGVRVHRGMFILRVLEPSLSFGQAYRLVETLNRSSRAETESGGGQAQAEAQLRRAIADSGVNAVIGGEWRLWEWRRSQDEIAAASASELDRTGAGHKASEATVLELLRSSCAGRMLLLDELQGLLRDFASDVLPEQLTYWVQRAWLLGIVQLQPGLAGRAVRARGWLQRIWPTGIGRELQCDRCGTTGKQERAGETAATTNTGIAAGRLVWSSCPHCGEACAYCESCIGMGRIRSCTPVVYGGKTLPLPQGEASTKTIEERLSGWGLSEIQAVASGEALQFLKARKSLTSAIEECGRFLIWAVTGAGKTEMIFPLIDYAVEEGGRVAVVTPRKDVVLELKPRLKKAFPHLSVVTLYGGSEERWEVGQVTLATTHQMLRFRHAFDLVIVDEIDAFPYHNNPLLLHAVKHACASAGAFILLSATPPDALQREVKSGRLPHARVPARYHRHPLPEPKLLRCPPLRRLLQQGHVPRELEAAMKRSIDRGAQLFVFVPNIVIVEPFVALLRRVMPGVRIEGTSSKDAERGEKVVAFRAKEIRLLVTTTILERGVTIPKSDVFILEAGSSMFDAAALVQMAGRAGRSGDDPNGYVFFAAEEKTFSQGEAIRQIRTMNQLARRKGYLRS